MFNGDWYTILGWNYIIGYHQASFKLPVLSSKVGLHNATQHKPTRIHLGILHNKFQRSHKALFRCQILLKPTGVSSTSLPLSDGWLHFFLLFFFNGESNSKQARKAELILSSAISLAAPATLLEAISSPTPAPSLRSICSCCANPSAVNNRTLRSWPKEAFSQRQHVGLKRPGRFGEMSRLLLFYFFDKMLC